MYFGVPLTLKSKHCLCPPFACQITYKSNIIYSPISHSLILQASKLDQNMRLYVLYL